MTVISVSMQVQVQRLKSAWINLRRNNTGAKAMRIDCRETGKQRQTQPYMLVIARMYFVGEKPVCFLNTPEK